MCVLLCANSRVREWLDMPLARAYREILQSCPACDDGKLNEALVADQPLQQSTTTVFELTPAAHRRVMKRSAWLQAYCRYSAQPGQHISRFEESDNAFTSTRDW